MFVDLSCLRRLASQSTAVGSQCHSEQPCCPEAGAATGGSLAFADDESLAHAFGQGLPRRALQLSPDHAVFVDDVLVPIKLLVNGSTIVQRNVARFSYYHVELPRHDILLAEGLPVESYLETGGRPAFENGGEVMQLHPNFAPDPVRAALIWDSEGYAPLMAAPRQLAPIKDRLERQAEALDVARKGRRRASKAA